MLIALVHNEGAGDKAHSTAGLLQILREFGHTVEAYSKDEAGLARAIDSRPDVLAAAGGDGTVARVANALCGSEIPMFVLPIGTANNIATSIGVGLDSVSTLVRGLSTPRFGQLDVCRITVDDCATHFVEAAGIGVIGTMLDRERRRINQLSERVRGWLSGETDHWQSTAQYVAHLLRKEPPRWISIRADGHDLSGEYATVEAMNIRSIGPRILLAPNAQPGDGWLDLVLITGADQDSLSDDIAARRAPAIGATSVRRVRHIEIDWPDEATHVDDETWPDGAATGRSRRASISIHGAVKLLLPG